MIFEIDFFFTQNMLRSIQIAYISSLFLFVTE